MVIPQAPAASTAANHRASSASQQHNNSSSSESPQSPRAKEGPSSGRQMTSAAPTMADKAVKPQDLQVQPKNESSPSSSDNSKAQTSATTSADKQLFKRLPERLQGLFALGVLSDKKASQAKVIASAQASARQVQLLLPLLKQDKGFNSAELIRQPPTLLKLDLSGHQLITISRQAFNIGDTVNLRLDPQGRLQLNTQHTQTSTGAGSTGNYTSTAIDPKAARHIKLGIANQGSGQLSIQQALRESLPQQQQLSVVLNQLRNLSHNLANLPRDHNLLNASSRLLVDQLSDRLPSLAQLSQTRALKQAIVQSGIGQEAQLAKLSASKLSASKLSTVEPSLPATSAPSGLQGYNSLADSKAHTASAVSDVKTLLARLAQSLRNEVQLGRLSSAQTSSAQRQISANPISPRISSDLNAILEQLLNPQSALTAKTQTALLDQFKQLQGPQLRLLREQIKQKLIHLSQSGIAKVQTQQLNMLSEPASGVLQRWLMELPFSLQGSVHSVEIEIQKRAPQKRKESTTTVQNQWQLRLNLDLNDLGALQVDVKLVAECGNIQLWLAKPEALHLAQGQLSKLRDSLTQQGLELEELRCHHGIPPKLETSLQFQLINTQA